MNRKILNIQALRGVAALMVLVPHLKNYDNRFGGGMLPGGRWWAVGNAGVDLFFVISGFVMVTVAAGRFGRAGEPSRFLIRRAARIYPLYWVFSLLILPLYLNKPGMVNAHDGGARIVLWKSFLLLPQQASPLIAQGWTLIHELYFYLVFAAMLAFRESWLPALFVAWGALVLIGSRTLSPTVPTFDIVANPLTFEFIAGACVGMATRGERAWRGGWILAVGCVSLIAGSLHTTDLASPWQRAEYFGLPSALIVFGAVAVERAGATAPRWLVACGDASYSIYLCQGLVLAALARSAWKHVHAGLAMNALVVAGMAAVSVIAGFACFRLIETPLVGLTKKAFEKKSIAPVIAAQSAKRVLDTIT